VIIHTMVGSLSSTNAMFRAHGYGGTDPPVGVGGKRGPDADSGLDGVAYQWQDTDFTADANLDANRRAISIETADNAPRSADDLQPWTDKQVETISQITAWACERYSIPTVLVEDSRSDRRGIAYHRQGIDPWREDGTEHWSTSRGKECPGQARIQQISTQIIPRVRSILADRAPTEQEPDMDNLDRSGNHKLTEADAAAMGDPTREGDEVSWSSLLRFPPAVARVRREQANRHEELMGKLDELIEAVQGLRPPGGSDLR
jgi:hypothetical protein